MLADRCAEVGAPEVNRSVLANIESGRRDSVSVDELMILALALDVSPVDLLAADQDDGEVALVPGDPIPTRTAREWVCGLLDIGLDGAMESRRQARAAWDLSNMRAALRSRRDALREFRRYADEQRVAHEKSRLEHEKELAKITRNAARVEQELFDMADELVKYAIEGPDDGEH